MAEEIKILERVYTIPLRRAWVNVPEYKRSRKAIMAIKIFIARHMKVTDRDLDKVKLDIYLNNDVWHKGKASPPSKVKVRAVKEGEIVKVSLFETPQRIKFLKLRHLKMHKKVEDKLASKPAESKDAKEKTLDQKKDENEKEKAVEQQNIKQADAQAKADKHITSPKEQKIHRMALKN
jgi:large subunit ribosomal protein L31e